MLFRQTGAEAAAPEALQGRGGIRLIIIFFFFAAAAALRGNEGWNCQSLRPYGGANELRLIALIHLRVASRRYFLARTLNFYKWPRCILETNGRLCISCAGGSPFKRRRHYVSLVRADNLSLYNYCMYEPLVNTRATCTNASPGSEAEQIASTNRCLVLFYFPAHSPARSLMVIY